MADSYVFAKIDAWTQGLRRTKFLLDEFEVSSDWLVALTIVAHSHMAERVGSPARDVDLAAGAQATFADWIVNSVPLPSI